MTDYEGFSKQDLKDRYEALKAEGLELTLKLYKIDLEALGIKKLLEEITSGIRMCNKCGRIMTFTTLGYICGCGNNQGI